MAENYQCNWPERFKCPENDHFSSGAQFWVRRLECLDIQ